MGFYGDVRDTLEQLPHSGEGYIRSDIFPTKFELMRRECPDARRVFEFGALYGYFLVTAAACCPDVTWVGWVDPEQRPGSNAQCVENLAEFRRLTGRQFRHWYVTRTLDVSRRLLSADIVHVDGNHGYDACTIDLTLSLALKPRLILVDDYTAIQTVTDATNDFANYLGLEVECFETVNGFAALRPQEVR